MFQQKMGSLPRINNRSQTIDEVAEPLDEPENVSKILEQKVDIKQLNALNDVKTNKVDTEQLMRCVDIMHKQITHIMVLIIELGKTIVTQQKES